MHDNQRIPFWNQYNLTVEEAAQYFRIGENKLRKLIAENPDAEYILHIGGKTLIKRTTFEKFVDVTDTI